MARYDVWASCFYIPIGNLIIRNLVDLKYLLFDVSEFSYKLAGRSSRGDPWMQLVWYERQPWETASSDFWLCLSRFISTGASTILWFKVLGLSAQMTLHKPFGRFNRVILWKVLLEDNRWKIYRWESSSRTADREIFSMDPFKSNYTGGKPSAPPSRRKWMIKCSFDLVKSVSDKRGGSYWTIETPLHSLTPFQDHLPPQLLLSSTSDYRQTNCSCFFCVIFVNCDCASRILTTPFHLFLKFR